MSSAKYLQCYLQTIPPPINPYPKLKATPVSECPQGLSFCTHACMDGGDGSRRCDHNSFSADGLNQP